MEFGPTSFYATHRSLFDHHEEAVVLANEIVHIFNSTLTGLTPSEHQLAQQAVLAQSLNTYGAIPVLCNFGCGNQALMLDRSLFEHLVAIKFMRVDIDLYAVLYNRSEEIAEIWELHEMESKSWPEVPQRPPKFQGLLRAAQTIFDDLRAKIPQIENWDDLKKYVRKTWSGVLLPDMCNQIDANPQMTAGGGYVLSYHREYRGLSGFTHGTGGARRANVKLTESGHLYFDPRPSDELVPPAFVLASKYFLRILEDILISPHFAIPDEYKNRWIALHDGYEKHGSEYGLEDK